MIKTFFKRILWWSAGTSLLATTLLVWQRLPHLSPGALATIAFVSFAVMYIFFMVVFILASHRQRLDFYTKALHEEHHGVFPAAAFEYRSRLVFLGLPLVHVRIGDRFDLLRGPVKAWIAMGNYSIGGLFSFGGISVAPFSVGFITAGLLPFSAIAIGLFPMGGIAIGPWAFGALAIGWESLGCFSIAWKAALGFVAIARDFAQGGITHAAQTNNDLVQQFVANNRFFRIGEWLGRFSLLLNLVWILPLVLQQQIIARKNKETDTAA